MALIKSNMGLTLSVANGVTHYSMRHASDRIAPEVFLLWFFIVILIPFRVILLRAVRQKMRLLHRLSFLVFSLEIKIKFKHIRSRYIGLIESKMIMKEDVVHSGLSTLAFGLCVLEVGHTFQRPDQIVPRVAATKG